MLSLSFFVAAAASTLVSAQFGPPAPPGCTANSFAIPSWMIENFQYTTAGRTSFHISNRATNYTADLTCSGANGGWSVCSKAANYSKPWSNDTLQVSVQVSPTSAEFLVNQTWSCSDKNATALPFIAFGNASVAVNSDGHAVYSPLLVRGSILSPVAITPQYASGPTGHSNPGCADASKAAWTLSAPFYSNQTGDGITAIASQAFTVLVTNTANGYQAGCMSGAGFGDGLTPTPATGPLNLVCAGSEFQASNGGRYSINTAATFDPATFTFNINQTWYCDDVNAAKPVQMSASASQSLPLSCTTIQGGSDTDGNFTSVKSSCINHGDVALAAETLTDISLTPYSIEDPIPGPDACTISSIYNPEWTFSAFEIDTEQDNSSSLYFEVILRTGSPGFQFPISIMQGAPVTGQSGWYHCNVGAGGDTGPALWPTACTFKYEPATKGLTLKAQWTCSDLDADHPITFSGTTTTSVEQPLTCETVNGELRCTMEDGAYQWTADISDVTWHQ